MDMPNKLQWSALEYELKEKTPDWFWALGIVVVAGAIASILFGNFFFALLLVVSGVLMAFFSVKEPENITYELNRMGFKIKNRIYPYEKIKSFWVQKNPTDEERELHGSLPEEEIRPTLFIKSEGWLMPILSVPIEEELADNIRNIFRNHDVEEEKMKEHFSDAVMEFLGF